MTLRLNGTSSGFTEIDAPAAAGSNKITLPTSNGSAEQFLKNSGTAGELEFSSMVETSTGIGLGTSSPAYEFDVRSSDTTTVNINAGTSNLSRLFFSDTTDGLTNFARGFFNYDHSDDSLRIGSAGSEGLRLDSSRRLLINHTADTAPQGYNSKLQLCDTSYQGSSLLIRRDGGASGPTLLFTKSRGTTKGANTVVQNGDNLGTVRFFAADGTDTDSEAAYIRAQADATPGSNSTPGRLIFATTSNNTDTPSERMRIISNGHTKFSDSASYFNSAASYHEFNQSVNAQCMIFKSSNASYTATQFLLTVNRAATSSYWFIQGTSGGGTDTEFYIRGDGTAYADGSWNGGGADYAEYFEWSDGNTEAEDRRGISVVLDGDKIREAVDGEEPIGVISGNPSVVGDADIDRWKGKYLRDDYGTYIQDTHNVVEWDETITDDEGNESTKKHSYEDWNIPAGIVVPDDAVVSATDENGQPYTHRRLNPDYNPDTAYVTRENRPEWDTVGLMGKLRIRKGQVTGARWIKMRDVSDTVEEWLVR